MSWVVYRLGSDVLIVALQWNADPGLGWCAQALVGIETAVQFLDLFLIHQYGLSAENDLGCIAFGCGGLGNEVYGVYIASVGEFDEISLSVMESDIEIGGVDHTVQGFMNFLIQFFQTRCGVDGARYFKKNLIDFLGGTLRVRVVNQAFDSYAAGLADHTACFLNEVCAAAGRKNSVVHCICARAGQSRVQSAEYPRPVFGVDQSAQSFFPLGIAGCGRKPCGQVRVCPGVHIAMPGPSPEAVRLVAGEAFQSGTYEFNQARGRSAENNAWNIGYQTMELLLRVTKGFQCGFPGDGRSYSWREGFQQTPALWRETRGMA